MPLDAAMLISMARIDVKHPEVVLVHLLEATLASQITLPALRFGAAVTSLPLLIVTSITCVLSPAFWRRTGTARRSSAASHSPRSVGPARRPASSRSFAVSRPL